MKIKSNRYQGGGIIYTPLIAKQEQSSGTSSSEKISGTIKKEIIDILKENGIPSDVDAFLNKANEFLSNSTSLSSKSLFGGTDNDYSMSDLITIQKMANDVKWNKSRYDEAIKNLDAENAWGEVALDSRGYMYVSDKDGNITTVDPSKFDRENQFVLTNEQMLGMRERSGQFAMNSNVLNSISGTVGMKTVQDYLLGLVEKLGTSSLQGYASKEQNQIINGVRELMQAGPDGYYKITDKSQAKDINSALQYLHNQLTPQMKRTLEATVAANGGDVAKDKYNFLAMILSQNVDFEQKADFDQSATKHALEQSGQDKTQKVQDTYLSRIAHGQGEWTTTSIVPIAAKVSDKGSWLVPAAIVGPMVDKSMNRLPQMSLASLKTQAEAMKATIETDVTFGAQLISPEQERAILWDGSSQLTNVMLPYKNVNGRITPNFDLLLNFNNFQEELKKHPNISNFEKSSLMRKYGLTGEDVVEKDGVFELKNTMMFLTFSAYADDDNIDFTDTTERFTEDVSNAEGVRIKDMFNNAVKYGNVTPTKSQKASAVGGYDKARRWDFRKGNVFIPIKSAYLGDHMSMNQYVSKDMMNRFDVRSQLATEMAQAPTISGQFS